jgi:K319L-like, PKD domain
MPKTNLCIIIFSFLSVLSACKKDVDPIDVDPPENKVPLVNAGLSQAITLPTNTITLTGSAVDSDGTVVAYLWSQISGPSATNIVNAGSASTEITSFLKGTYVFQLMATDDKGATGVDTASVVVNPAPIQTLTLQPSNNPNEYQVTVLNGQDASGFTPEISIDAWTSSSQLWILRDFLKFDLSTIPTNANIMSANLYLYSNPKPLTGNLVDANFGTDNSLLLQQVTSNWSTSTINWFNQPAGSTANQIIIPTTTQSTLDLDIDVSSMVSSMISSGSNFGFLLKLQTEAIYNSRIFVSSSNTTYTDKHPKLVVVYQ